MRLTPSLLLLSVLVAARAAAQPPARTDLPPAPPGARHDAGCSAALTESAFGLQWTVAFAVDDVPAARAFYRARGWQVLGGARSGYTLISPDRRIRGSLASQLTDFRRVAADVEARGLKGYDHVKACVGIPDGAALILSEHAG